MSVPLQVTVKVVADLQAELEMDPVAEPNNRWSEGAPHWLPAEEEDHLPRTVRVRTRRRTDRNTVEMTTSRASMGLQEAGSRAHCPPETGPSRSLIAMVSTRILTSLAAAPGDPERK